MNDQMKASYVEKQKVIDEIKGKFDKSKSAVAVDYIGITVSEADEMRKALREEDVDYTVYRNTMVIRAIEGTDFEAMTDILKGPSAFAFSYEDATAPARVINDAIKKFKKMEFKGGFVEGTYYDADGIKEIAKIPSRDTLIAKFMGSISSPIGKAVRTLAAIAEAKAEGGEATEAPAEEATPEAKPAEEAAPAEAEAPAAEEAQASDKE